VTSLANREYFMNRLVEIVDGGDTPDDAVEKEAAPGTSISGEDATPSLRAADAAGNGGEIPAAPGGIAAAGSAAVEGTAASEGGEAVIPGEGIEAAPEVVIPSEN